MSISSVTSKVIYVGDGATATLAYPFYILAEGDLTVSKYVTLTSVATVLTLNTDYAVTGVGVDAGGNVLLTGSYAGGMPTGSNTIIQREVDLTQTVDYVENDPFPADTHERAIDKLCMATQQLQDGVDRAIKADINQTSSNVAYVDFVNQQIAATSSATVSVAQASAAAASASAAGASETAAGLSETASASSAAVAVTQAATATTQAGVATSSATVSISAANSSIGRDTAAASSATVAVASQVAAASSATVTVASQVAAASSATVTVASQIAAASSATVTVASQVAAASSATVAVAQQSTATVQATAAASSATVAIAQVSSATVQAVAAASSATVTVASQIAAASSATVAVASQVAAASSGTVCVSASAGAVSEADASASSAAVALAAQALVPDPTGEDVGDYIRVNAGQDGWSFGPGTAATMQSAYEAGSTVLVSNSAGVVITSAGSTSPLYINKSTGTNPAILLSSSPSIVASGNIDWDGSNMNPTNLLSNGDFELWSAGKTADVGRSASWVNQTPAYQTLTSSGGNITSAIDDGVDGGMASNAFDSTLVAGVDYVLTVTVTGTIGDTICYLTTTEGGTVTHDFGTLSAGLNTFAFTALANSNYILLYSTTAGAVNFSCTITLKSWAAPDGWILSDGGSASIVREGTITKIGSYSAKCTNPYGIYQSIASGTTAYWKGRTVTLGTWVYATAGSVARIALNDGGAGSWRNSSYHTGDSTWQFLTVSMLVGADAIYNPRVLMDVEDTGDAYFDGAICVEGSTAFAFSPKPVNYDNPVMNGTATITNAGTGQGLYINQTANGAGCMEIDNDGTGYGLLLRQDAVQSGTGYALYIYSNAIQVASALALIHQDHASSSEPALEIVNDGTGYGIEVSSPLAYALRVTEGAIYIANTTAARQNYFYNNVARDASVHNVIIHDNGATTNSDAATLKVNIASASQTEPALEIVNAGTGAGIEISSSSSAHIRLTGDAPNGSPIDGDFWFDGTSFKVRIGAVTAVLSTE